MFPIQTDARIQILAGVSLLHSSRPVGGQEGLAGYGRRYTGTKPETVDTRQADALRSRPVLSYSETGRSLVRIQSPRPLWVGLLRVVSTEDDRSTPAERHVQEYRGTATFRLA